MSYAIISCICRTEHFTRIEGLRERRRPETLAASADAAAVSFQTDENVFVVVVAARCPKIGLCGAVVFTWMCFCLLRHCVRPTIGAASHRAPHKSARVRNAFFRLYIIYVLVRLKSIQSSSSSSSFFWFGAHFSEIFNRRPKPPSTSLELAAGSTLPAMCTICGIGLKINGAGAIETLPETASARHTTIRNKSNNKKTESRSTLLSNIYIIY